MIIFTVNCFSARVSLETRLICMRILKILMIHVKHYVEYMLKCNELENERMTIRNNLQLTLLIMKSCWTEK